MSRIRCEQVRRYLTLLHGDALQQRPGLLVAITGLPSAAHCMCASIDEAVRAICDGPGGGWCSRENIYAGVGLLARRPAKRGSAQDVGALPGVWADLDIAGRGHKSAKPYPRSMDEAMAIAYSGPAPSFIVRSGFGIHPYWCFDRPLLVSEENRDEVKAFLNQWKVTVFAWAAAKGRTVDAVFDLARIMRVPGTLNFKGDPPAEVVLEAPDQIVRYSLDVLKSEMVEPECAPAKPDKAQFVSIGSFVIRPDARVPEHRFKFLSMASPKFTATWEGHRPDIKDQSASGFDLAMANMGYSLGLRDQEVVDLIVARRLARGISLENLHYSKLRTTLQKAKANYAHLDEGDAGPPSAESKDVTHETVMESQIESPNLDDPLVRAQRTDVGNAARLVHRHGHDLRYCAPLKAFFIWNGVRWEEDQRCKIVGLCKETALAIYDEAKAHQGEAHDALIKHALASQRKERIAAMEALARPDLAILPSDLDTPSLLFNCPNGTLDLRTGQLREHRREDLLTKMCPVPYDPEAQCPRFEQFLSEILPPATAAFVQRWLGHCLTGDISEQYLVVVYGDGANGKSTLLDTMLYVMGEYATVGAPDLLTVRRNEEHSTEVADLFGRRFVCVSESERGARLREQMVKRLTGDSVIKARRMRMDFFEFERACKVVLVTNNIPEIAERTEAIWRRIVLVPFATIVPRERQHKGLLAQLKNEAPGVLAWLVRGCLEWQRSGLQIPDSLRRVAKKYRAKCDSLAAFLGACCVRDPEAWTSNDALREAHRRFCVETGRSDEPSDQQWSAALHRMECQRKRRHDGRGWVGIRLTGGP